MKNKNIHILPIITKQTIEAIAQDFAKSKSSSEVFQHTHIRDFLAGYNHAQTEIEELRRDNEEFIDTLGLSIQIIERLIASEKVVNLDEFLGYFKQLITKHNG